MSGNLQHQWRTTRQAEKRGAEEEVSWCSDPSDEEDGASIARDRLLTRAAAPLAARAMGGKILPELTLDPVTVRALEICDAWDDPDHHANYIPSWLTMSEERTH